MKIAVNAAIAAVALVLAAYSMLVVYAICSEMVDTEWREINPGELDFPDARSS